MNTSIKIANLKCNGCSTTIKNSLTKFNEVNFVEIDMEESLINIEFTGDDTNIEKYKKKLSKLGYPEQDSNNMISVAKSYVSCAIGRISN